MVVTTELRWEDCEEEEEEIEEAVVSGVFLRDKHVMFFTALLHRVNPSLLQSLDTNRLLLLYFAVATLDVLGETRAMQAASICDWVYTQQCRTGGFAGGGLDGNGAGHMTFTHCAVFVLALLGDDFSRLDLEGLQRFMRNMQLPSGNFTVSQDSPECDVRFIYSAAVVRALLGGHDWFDVDRAVEYAASCQTYEGGFSGVPRGEAHGGMTYCAVASLVLLAGRQKVDALVDEVAIVRYSCQRQRCDNGAFQGRPGKLGDTCYTFWFGGTLALLDAADLVDWSNCTEFVLRCQSEKFGGVGKDEDAASDPMHACLGIAGAAIGQLSDLPSGPLRGLVQKVNPGFGGAQEWRW